MNIPNTLSPQVKTTLTHYLNLQLGHKSVPCPYIISKKSARINLIFDYRLQGKGSPQEIEILTKKLALRSNFDLNQASVDQIRQFMRRKNIGVDCSGFAYHMLNAFHKAKTGRSISRVLTRPFSPNPLNWLRHIRYRLNVKVLTGPRNSNPLLGDLALQCCYLPGDLIRTQSGRHVLIILESDKKHFIYAHSSHRNTKVKGVHLGEITIINPTGPLENQIWHEQTPDSQSYKTQYHPEDGDGVFRLKTWGEDK